MKILLVNDDGINAPGILALVKELTGEHELVVVAPDGQRSGYSQSITYLYPIGVKQVSIEGYTGIPAYAVSGSPADCTKLAMLSLPNEFDLVVSGINNGENMGRDICYSGTFGAALEGAIYGKKAIAISCFTEHCEPAYDYAAQFLSNFLRTTPLDSMPDNTVLNINIPVINEGKAKGVMVTAMAGLQYDEYYEQKRVGEATLYQLMCGDTREAEEGTDIWAVLNGYVSISMLGYNRTDNAANDWLKHSIK